MRHLLHLNAVRNIGFVATVSARALKVDGASLAVFFHHDGIRPQRIVGRSRPVSRGTTTLIIVVGATLQRGSMFTGWQVSR